MNPASDVSSPRLAVFGQPCPAPAREWPAEAGTTSTGGGKSIDEILADLLDRESALHVITRDGRYQTAGRKLCPLHALLDEQLSEIGIRLTQLAARRRELGFREPTGHRDRASRRHAAVDAGPGDACMIRELLRGHEDFIARLKRSAEASRGFRDRGTIGLLAELTASHERDAFMLRALLWQVENVSS